MTSRRKQSKPSKTFASTSPASSMLEPMDLCVERSVATIRGTESQTNTEENYHSPTSGQLPMLARPQNADELDGNQATSSEAIQHFQQQHRQFLTPLFGEVPRRSDEKVGNNKLDDTLATVGMVNFLPGGAFVAQQTPVPLPSPATMSSVTIAQPLSQQPGASLTPSKSTVYTNSKEDNVTFMAENKRARDEAKIAAYDTQGDTEYFCCPICDMRQINGKDKLTAHLRDHQMKTKREDGKHVCCLCGHELSSNSSLERHLLTHTNYRPFDCNFCNKSFTTNGNLSRHIKTTHETSNGGVTNVSNSSPTTSLKVYSSGSLNTASVGESASASDSNNKFIIFPRQQSNPRSTSPSLSTPKKSSNKISTSALPTKPGLETTSMTALSLSTPQPTNLTIVSEPPTTAPPTFLTGTFLAPSLAQHSTLNCSPTFLTAATNTAMNHHQTAPTVMAQLNLRPFLTSTAGAGFFTPSTVAVANSPSPASQLLLLSELATKQTAPSPFHFLNTAFPTAAMASTAASSTTAPGALFPHNAVTAKHLLDLLSFPNNVSNNLHQPMISSSAADAMTVSQVAPAPCTDHSQVKSKVKDSLRFKSGRLWYKGFRRRLFGLTPKLSNSDASASLVDKNRKRIHLGHSKRHNFNLHKTHQTSPSTSLEVAEMSSAFQTPVKYGNELEEEHLTVLRHSTPVRFVSDLLSGMKPTVDSGNSNSLQNHPRLPQQLEEENESEMALDLTVPHSSLTLHTSTSTSASPQPCGGTSPSPSDPNKGLCMVLDGLMKQGNVANPVEKAASSGLLLDPAAMMMSLAAANGNLNFLHHIWSSSQQPMVTPATSNTWLPPPPVATGEKSVNAIQEISSVQPSSNLHSSAISRENKAPQPCASVLSLATSVATPASSLTGIHAMNKKKNSYKNAPKLMTCPWEGCHQKFPWQSSLKRHLITHIREKPYKCTRCTKSFSTKSNRERHMERVHHLAVKRTKRFFQQQQRRQQGGADGSGAMIDTASLHSESDASLTSSNARTSSAGVTAGTVVSVVASASVEELNEEEILCIDVNDKYAENISNTLLKEAGQPLVEPNPERLNADLQARYVQLPSVTGQAVSSKSHLSRMSNSYSPALSGPSSLYMSLVCPLCNVEFMHSQDMAQHLHKVHMDRRGTFQCPVCPRAFSGRLETLRHLESEHKLDWNLLLTRLQLGNVQEVMHYLDRPEAVPAEEETTSESSNAAATATDVMFACCVCAREFPSSQEVQRHHVRCHTEPRALFACPTCHKEFALKHSMQRHMRCHT